MSKEIIERLMPIGRQNVNMKMTI